jgi:hydrogenase/urease accessory protein HupE
VKLGVLHILTGVDHLLFILALIIITDGGWKLVKTVTAFTVSHSITLTAATLGYVHVPQRPVEAVIALSIVFVASEIVHRRQGRSGLTEQWPWIIALTFGLLHGLGFAGALSDVGLPATHIPLALLFFSCGVETGQFLFIAAVLTLVAVARWVRVPFPRWAELLPPYAIGTVAMFWVISGFQLSNSLAERRPRAPQPPGPRSHGCRMNNTNKGLAQSALVMKIIGWGLIVSLALAAFIYSPGFLWGMLPAGFPQIGPAHPESPYDALHPYILMIAVLYLAWGF